VLADERVGARRGAMLGDGRSPGTARKVRDDVCALWRFLGKRGYRSVWPDVRPVVEPERVPSAWDEDELSRLFTACRQARGSIGGIAAGLWWESLHLVGWDTGERIAALLQTEWRDIDLDDRWFVSRAENRKGKRADKLFRLHPDTVERLRQMQSPQRREVWPWPYNYTYLWVRYKAILET